MFSPACQVEYVNHCSEGGLTLFEGVGGGALDWKPGGVYHVDLCDYDFDADGGGNDDLSSLTFVLCHPFHHSFKTEDVR